MYYVNRFASIRRTIAAKKPAQKVTKRRKSKSATGTDRDSMGTMDARVSSLEGEISGLRKTSDDILSHLKNLSGNKADTSTMSEADTVPNVDPVEDDDDDNTDDIVTFPTPAPRGRPKPYDRPTSRPRHQAAAGSAATAAATARDEIYDLLSTVTGPTRHLPVSLHSTDAAVSSQVQSLLTTAHHLSAAKGKNTHPHHYVFRGPNRVKTTLRCLAPAEYIWGLLRMIKDPTNDPHTSRAIMTHLLQLVEDAKDFDWRQVRDWSEEVLGKIADNTITWEDTDDIRGLRGNTSQFKNGRLYDSHPPEPAEGKPKARPPIRHVPAPPVETPCPAWNKTGGCPKPDGHVEAGIIQGHHCKFCREHMNSFNNHPKWDCRNKRKTASSRYQGHNQGNNQGYNEGHNQGDTQGLNPHQPTFRPQAGYDRPQY